MWYQTAREPADPEDRTERWPARRLACWATWVMLVAAVAAVGALEWALLGHDFSVRYVADNGGRSVPTYYTVISLWADLEGSLLLWLLVLAAVTVAVMFRPDRRAAVLHPWAMSVLAGVATFFFWLALFAGNAFARVSPVPPDGPGPNPLLRDHPLMGVHPPLLYLGYVGLTVPFAYAVAALVTGRTGGAWAQVVRRWTLTAWAALTLGVVMGGWWSYEVLGWGGYWAWDPVENASIMPWFVATALLHSIMVQRRRATLRLWNLTLAVAAFLLVLVGTFLTRSGVVASVHSFTQSPIGPILLGFIIAVLVFSGVLLVWRHDRLGHDEGLGGALSRETVFLGNNLLLVGLAITVLVGTVFPLLAEAVNGARISVGAPYFNQLTIPLALAVIVLMGIGPLVPWGRSDPRTLRRRLTLPALVGLATIGGLGLAGLTGLGALVTFGLAAFVLATIAAQLASTVAGARRSGSWPRQAVVAVVRRRRRFGGLLVHAGVVLAAVAIAASGTYTSQIQRELAVGESVSVAGYTAQLTALHEHQDASKTWVEAHLQLSRGGTELGSYAPALNRYPGQAQAIGTPSVRTGLSADAYLVLAEADLEQQTATVSLSVRPLVGWLWASAAVMLAGALLAGWPTRRRPTSPQPAVDLSERVGASP
jgi:cytochrome c-type biogenesis protein CcmF